MRNPKRLDIFYDTIKRIHKESFPDLRFGQLFYNFWYWLANEKDVDIFFPEEYEMMKLFEEYVNGAKTDNA